uniref:Uncharacterized protein n=1 Tax=Acrobeloides nanus TaxID=290746 RepID=A0A914CKV2_9BILA
MLIGDFISLIFINLLVAIPTTFVGNQIYSDTTLHYITAMDTVYYHSFVFHAFLLTSNRFCVFICKFAEPLFIPKYLYMWPEFMA